MKSNTRKHIINNARRVVVKVGSAVIAKGDFDSIAIKVDAFTRAGKEVVLVTSGAIAMGMEKLGITERPSTIPERQALAAIGQTVLMNKYEAAFAKQNQKVAQVLLTHGDLGSRESFNNARNTLNRLFELGVVPIINENDTVAVEELKFGDNDNLSALVVNLIGADLLVIYTDVSGIHDKDPWKNDDANIILEIEDIDSFKSSFDGCSGASLHGTGGMSSKVSSAGTAAHFGAATIIANGLGKNAEDAIISGGKIAGTFIYPKEDRLTSKKHWIAYSARTSGRIIVDAGAMKAVTEDNKSLLPSGIVGVEGVFKAGEVVHCHALADDKTNKEFAR
ncbi:MAG: glutamate 5-kinase, partial [Deltaproteobacteria bacterium]|nr:glutamate 5-kinase [Deltaproteobacteria bacterium]